MPFPCIIRAIVNLGVCVVGIMSLFKRWLGGAVQEAAPLVPAVQAPARPLDAMPVVVRAEIIDQRHRLCGYRFHAVARPHGAPLAESAMVAALLDARVPEFAAQRLALIPLSLDAVTFSRHLPLLAPNTLFLLDRRHSELSVEQLAGRMAALRETGAQVAVRGVSLAPEEAPLLARRADVERFCHEVDELRDASARLQKRLERLS